MYSMHLIVGASQVHIETDEKLSFDAVETLLNRGTLTALTLMNAHMGAALKYDQAIEQDTDCDECNIEGLNIDTDLE
jgi:hypothetical protein